MLKEGSVSRKAKAFVIACSEDKIASILHTQDLISGVRESKNGPWGQFETPQPS